MSQYTPRNRGRIDGTAYRVCVAGDVIEVYRFMRSRHYTRDICRNVAHALRLNLAIYG